MEKGKTIFEKDGKVVLFDDFFKGDLYNAVDAEVDWKQYSGVLFGKKVLYPRLNAYYGEKPYQYSGTFHEACSFPPILTALKEKIEEFTRFQFNAVLLNFYLNGSHYLGWHSDDEREMDVSLIASVSLGGVRTFKMKHKHEKSLNHSIELTNGSLLLMVDCQRMWKHQIPKTARRVDPRINITFRNIH